jgi:hypothetical protein
MRLHKALPFMSRRTTRQPDVSMTRDFDDMT